MLSDLDALIIISQTSDIATFFEMLHPLFWCGGFSLLWTFRFLLNEL